MFRFLAGMLLGAVIGGGGVQAAYTIYDIDDVMSAIQRLDCATPYDIDCATNCATQSDIMIWCSQ